MKFTRHYRIQRDYLFLSCEIWLLFKFCLGGSQEKRRDDVILVNELNKIE